MLWLQDLLDAVLGTTSLPQYEQHPCRSMSLSSAPVNWCIEVCTIAGRVPNLCCCFASCCLVLCCVQRDDAKEATAAAAPPAAAAATAAAAAAPAAAAAAAHAGGLASMRSNSLRMAVAKRASSFRQLHFQAGSEAAGLESEGLQRLRQLCNQLGEDDGSCVAELLDVSAHTVGPGSFAQGLCRAAALARGPQWL